MIRIQEKCIEDEVCRLNSEGYTIESSRKEDGYYVLNYRKSLENKTHVYEPRNTEKIRKVVKKDFSLILYILKKVE